MVVEIKGIPRCAASNRRRANFYRVILIIIIIYVITIFINYFLQKKGAPHRESIIDKISKEIEQKLTEFFAKSLVHMYEQKNENNDEREKPLKNGVKIEH